MIALAAVSTRYASADRDAVSDVTLALGAGELCAVLGPNGSGKSTLLRLMAGLLAPSAGVVRVRDDDVAALARGEIARRVALVPQQSHVAFGFTVREIVAMGRAPHQSAWMRASAGDHAAIARAIAACELEAVAERPVASLSGGEQKRVHVARALAQETPALLLDEAGAHLDVRHAQALHRLVRAQVRERSLTCVAVMHDLAAAAQYADRVVLLRNGRVVADGSVAEVMQPELLSDVFEAEIHTGEHDGRRWFLA